MPYATTRLDIEKFDIARRLFTDTADDNYIAARWCYQEALNVDFFWLAVHALEKYMKAILLINRQSAATFTDENGNKPCYGHDITLLYSQVSELTGALLPGNLEQPSNLNITHWRNETPEQFVQRLLDYGNADNRYMIYGFVIRPEDVHKLDRMVFVLRRLSVPLDAYYLGEPGKRADVGTYGDVLARSPSHWCSLGGPLDKAINNGRGESLRHMVLNLNMAFAPEDFDHGPARGRSAAANPVLSRRILEPLKGNNQNAAKMASDTCAWVLDNIKLPKDVRNQLNAARKHYPSSSRDQ